MSCLWLCILDTPAALVSHLLTHRHLEAGHQLLGRDLGFQIPNYILPLDTHDLIHHVGLELQLRHWEREGRAVS